MKSPRMLLHFWNLIFKLSGGSYTKNTGLFWIGIGSTYFLCVYIQGVRNFNLSLSFSLIFLRKKSPLPKYSKRVFDFCTWFSSKIVDNLKTVSLRQFGRQPKNQTYLSKREIIFLLLKNQTLFKQSFILLSKRTEDFFYRDEQFIRKKTLSSLRT